MPHTAAAQVGASTGRTRKLARNYQNRLSGNSGTYLDTYNNLRVLGNKGMRRKVAALGQENNVHASAITAHSTGSIWLGEQ